MNIKSIRVQNFRGFEDRSFEFDSKMNVVLGDNTTGKTTLLQAVQIALGAYLQAMSLIPGGKAYRRNFKQTDQVKKRSELSKSFLPDVNKPQINIVTDFYRATFNHDTGSINGNNIEVSWYRNSNNISRRSASELMNAVSEMEDVRRRADDTRINSIFPLMLSFGAARLDKNYKGAEKTKARETREAKAYKCALDEQVDFKSAFNWLYRYDKNLNKGKEFEGTIDAFLEAMGKAIPALKIIEIDTKNEEFNAEIQMTKDPAPHWLTYDMMSDGFKAMINIVAEIAYRCIELNGFLGRNAVKQTPGVVLIDELDLYLHPHWQQHVLADLQEAFPKFQFIVTTHSPFIVQSVDTNNIIVLDTSYIGSESPSNRGIEEIAAAAMGMEGMLRSEKYRKKQELADKYYKLVKEGKAGQKEIEIVRDELNKLEQEADLLNDPAYSSFLKLNRGNL
jgi:predicted ATP-binding protein involved in virulence